MQNELKKLEEIINELNDIIYWMHPFEVFIYDFDGKERHPRDIYQIREDFIKKYNYFKENSYNSGLRKICHNCRYCESEKEKLKCSLNFNVPSIFSKDFKCKSWKDWRDNNAE